MPDYGAARRKSEERRSGSLWRAGAGFEEAMRVFRGLGCGFVSLGLLASTHRIVAFEVVDKR
jgi:hypothetical protein